jgi:hypothetical protein
MNRSGCPEFADLEMLGHWFYHWRYIHRKLGAFIKAQEGSHGKD